MYPAPFYLDGNRFNCVEQYYMYRKAKTFNDTRAMHNIMTTCNPKKQKRIGRTIKHFNKNTWDNISPDIVRKAVYAKVKVYILS